MKITSPWGTTVEYEDLSNGRVRLDKTWAKNNIVKINIPLFWKDYWVHKSIVNPLCSALRELDNENFRKYLKTFDGCYNPRHINSDIKRPLSLHTWGIAIDINASTNPIGHVSNQHPFVVKTFKKWGWAWGGDWKGVRDPMHWEYRPR